LEKLLRDANIDDERVKAILTAKSLSQYEEEDPSSDLGQLSLRFDDDILNALEYIRIEKDCPVKEREQKWLSGDDDEEEEEDFGWVEPQKKKDPGKFSEETYFTLVNESRKPMKKGSQAWNCYGNRTNLFLLINYGFCFESNLYNSFVFYVKLNVDFKQGQYPSVAEMIP